MPDTLFFKSKQLIELSGDLTLQLALLYPFKKDGANGLTMGSKPILVAPILFFPFTATDITIKAPPGGQVRIAVDPVE